MLDLDKALKGFLATPSLKRVAVSPRTFCDLQQEIARVTGPMPLSDGNTGLSSGATLWGIDIVVSNSVPDGKLLMFDGAGTIMGITSAEPKPSPPPDPFIRVASVKEESPGRWVARDKEGGKVMDLTERGARDLAERRGIPFGR